jgi:hypothetical protein
MKMPRSLVMLKIISSIGLGLAVTFGSLSISAPVASAQGFDIQIGPNGLRARPSEPPPPPRRAGCSERQALAAAREEGLRRAEVVRRTERSITVEGDTRRGVQRIRFANAPGCPTLR